MLKEEKNYFIFKCLESEKKTHIGSYDFSH